MRTEIREKLDEVLNSMTIEKVFDLNEVEDYFFRYGDLNDYIKYCEENDLDNTSSYCDILYELFELNEEENKEHEQIRIDICEKYKELLTELKKISNNYFYDSFHFCEFLTKRMNYDSIDNYEKELLKQYYTGHGIDEILINDKFNINNIFNKLIEIKENCWDLLGELGDFPFFNYIDLDKNIFNFLQENTQCDLYDELIDSMAMTVQCEIIIFLSKIEEIKKYKTKKNTKEKII